MRNQKITYINLSDSSEKHEIITPELRRKYLGGGGFNSKILYDSDAMYFDSLSEKNILVFGAGSLVGTGMMAANRCVISAKSSITDMYGDSNIGGTFPIRMRQVGIDNLVFTGKAAKPVYVYIRKNGSVEFHSAEDLWGEYTDITTDILTERHGRNCEVACIGTSGEKLIRFACIMMSKNHAAGRMGMGCVMGSKNLKAIVIEAKQKKVELADKENFDRVKAKWLIECQRAMTTKLGKVYGTLFLMEINLKGKHLPIKNAMQGAHPNQNTILPDVFKVNHQVKKVACYGCPVGCSKKYEVKEGKYKGEKGERIEFGAAVSVGPYVGIFEWDSVIHLKLLCDRMGVDTIEVAASIGLVLECKERGLLLKEDFGGRDVMFGNADDVEYLMHLMDQRQGIGDLIAEGAYRAGKALNMSDYAFCINKSSTALQSKSRVVRSLGYLTSTRGGDHLKSFAFTMQNGGYYIAKYLFHIKNAKKQLGTFDKKGRVLWWHENYKNVVDALGVCLFAIQGLPNLACALFDDFADIMNALYGLNMTDREVLESSERIYQLQNAFNVNCGLTIDNYKWPVRKKDKDIQEEFLEQTTIDFRDEPGVLPEYFAYRGLRDGKPSVQKFKSLGMEEYIKKAECVELKQFKTLDEILEEVSIVIHFSYIEKKVAIFKNLMMGALLSKKSESAQKKEKKRNNLQNKKKSSRK